MEIQLTDIEHNLIMQWAENTIEKGHWGSATAIFPDETMVLRKLMQRRNGVVDFSERNVEIILTWAGNIVVGQHSFNQYVSPLEYGLLKKLYAILGKEKEFEEHYIRERRGGVRMPQVIIMCRGILNAYKILKDTIQEPHTSTITSLFKKQKVRGQILLDKKKFIELEENIEEMMYSLLRTQHGKELQAMEDEYKWAQKVREKKGEE